MDHKRNLSDRKLEHIEFAQMAQTPLNKGDDRFYYEPMLAPHPKNLTSLKTEFLGKKLAAPLWISSMTGGVGKARHINLNLAEVCAEYELGMGLGSCRPLLESDEYFDDFNLRPILGEERPFYSNIGIAQVEDLLANKSESKLFEIVERLKCDGVIVHVNPLQEWRQAEGDRFNFSPLETIHNLLEVSPFPIIIKEVGQGFGPASLKKLMELPLAAIDFAGLGGTNFTRLEDLRNKSESTQTPLSFVGHTCEEMVGFVNELTSGQTSQFNCQSFIISGGISSYLDGYYLMEKLKCTSIYGQGYAFLVNSAGPLEQLKKFVEEQLTGLAMAKTYLKVREDNV